MARPSPSQRFALGPSLSRKRERGNGSDDRLICPSPACGRGRDPLRSSGRVRGRMIALSLLAFVLASSGHAAEPWEETWAKTLAAAKQEGTVVVSGPPGALQRQVI